MDKTKMENLILYIAQECEGITEEKLNTILFKADFMAYVLWGKSITGATYYKMPEPNRKD